jgi:hypothetical protein
VKQDKEIEQFGNEIPRKAWGGGGGGGGAGARCWKGHLESWKGKIWRREKKARVMPEEEASKG